MTLGIETEQCWCLCYDQNENLLWIGTIDKGIYLVPMDGINYTKAKELNTEKPYINDVFVDSEYNIWLTVGDEIFKNVNSDTGLSIKKLETVYKNQLKLNSIYKSIGVINSKNIHHTTQKDSHISKASGYKTNYERLQDLDVNACYKINEDLKGNIWFNSNAGFFNVNKNLTQLDFFYPCILDIEFFFPKHNILTRVYSFFIENYDIQNKGLMDYTNFRKDITYASFGKHKIIDNNIWIINDTDGISLYKKDSLRFFPYLKNRINLNFNAICSDKENHIIVGTLTGEIYTLKYLNDSLYVTRKIELDTYLGNKINWLITDKSNNLYVGTNKGLVTTDLNKEDGRLKFFNKNNGFFDNEAYKAVLDSTGNILVISHDNITKIDKNFIKQTDSVLELIIKNIQVNNKPFDWSKISETDNWTNLPVSKAKLKHNQNSIIFSFDFLQYKNPENTQFSYQMEGLNMNWTTYSEETKAVFSYLKHGKYTFKVKGFNLSNPNNIVETQFEFRILPPWYKTWWFFTIISLIVLINLYLGYKYRIKKIKEKALIQQKISELKLDALKAQMNPHFIFNAFNSLQKFILQQETKMALNYMSEFASLIRKTLDNSTKKEISLDDELDYLKSYMELEKVRVSNLNYAISINNDLDEENVFIPPMLIQPFVENAILHGIRHLHKKGMINISFEKESSFLKVSIEDNGIGRTKSAEINRKNKLSHKSKGTNITQERIAMLSGNNPNEIKLKIIDLVKGETALGTRVELLISFY